MNACYSSQCLKMAFKLTEDCQIEWAKFTGVIVTLHTL